MHVLPLFSSLAYGLGSFFFGFFPNKTKMNTHTHTHIYCALSIEHVVESAIIFAFNRRKKIYCPEND